MSNRTQLDGATWSVAYVPPEVTRLRTAKDIESLSNQSLETLGLKSSALIG